MILVRKACGKPVAEMKWTKPSALEASYGVKLIGWPEEIPMRNPSNNTMKQNQTLLDGLKSETIRFVRADSRVRADPTATIPADGPTSCEDPEGPLHQTTFKFVPTPAHLVQDTEPPIDPALNQDPLVDSDEDEDGRERKRQRKLLF